MSAVARHDQPVHAPYPLRNDVLLMLQIEESDNVPRWFAAFVKDVMPEADVRGLRVHSAGAVRKKDAICEDFSVGEIDGCAYDLVKDDELLLNSIRRRVSMGSGSVRHRHVVVFNVGDEVRFVVDVRVPGPWITHPRLSEAASIAQGYFQRLARLEIDPLTRLRNRRVFQSHVDQGIRHWAAADKAYYLAMLDIDHFKKINDTFGHPYGDEVLVHFANVMRKTFRAGDLLYRFGGEEFVLIYSTDRTQPGDAPLERFRHAVENYRFPGSGKVTVSSGYAQITEFTTPAAILLDRADQAVYWAKANGRNRVAGWEHLIATGALAPAKKADAKDVTLF